MKKIAAADVVIFGGGVAGLWLLNRLRQQGYAAILFESNTLGGAQTHKAQGIIHGGMKYALQGVLTKDAEAMMSMPERWKACLFGQGDIDLTGVPILSPRHYLWSPNKFTGKIAGLMASTALTSRVDAVAKEDLPVVFQNSQFKGEVFALDEIVIDVPVLVKELVKACKEFVFKIEPLSEEQFKFDDQHRLVSTVVYIAGKAIEVSAQQFIFTAGAGNDVIIKTLKHPSLAMQRRPLHMVLVKTPFDYPLYAHCLGLGPRPRLTITTHYTKEGQAVWYLGGLLAEEGVDRESDAQIVVARKELVALFPWLDFTGASFSSFMIDRAEPKQSNGFKPESCVVQQIENMMIAWPTKLAFAPKLADEVLSKLSIAPALSDTRELRTWPMPSIAKPIWEEIGDFR